jgi:hypothetical protein
MSEAGCKCCGSARPNTANDPTWWQLTNYHSLSGLWCSTCYDKIAHDSYGQPKNPEEYMAIRLRMS